MTQRNGVLRYLNYEFFGGELMAVNLDSGCMEIMNVELCKSRVNIRF